MIERRYSPVDPETMLPLPVLPANAPSGEYALWSDWHHPFFENNSPDLSNESGRAVRHSRVQRTQRWLHNRYHYHYDTAVLPTSEYQKFKVGVLAVAGLLPEFGVDLSEKEPKIIKYDDDMRKFLRSTTQPEFRPNQSYEAKRGIFFMRYALAQGFDYVQQQEIEQFLETTNPEIKEKLGKIIVAKSFEQATEPIVPVYTKAQREGYISPKMPKRPASVILRKVVRGHQINYIDEITNKLEQAAA